MVGRSKEMKVGCWNVHLTKEWKRVEMVSWVKENEFDVFGTVEHWMKDSDVLMEEIVKGSGYEWIGKDRKGGRGIEW